MNPNYFIISFILLPLGAFLMTLFFSEKRERAISSITIISIGITLLTLLGFTIYWLYSDLKALNIKEVVLYQNKEYVFLIDFYFDKVTATYLMVGALISFLIVRYSSYYMHLEKGYKRFFITILFFYFSYNFTVLAGNFETLFVGWEMVGISSFLLIAFYRERYLPVRNAVKVFSVYRIGDIGILLAMWASHHLWHENITFQKLLNYDLVHEHLVEHSYVGLFIATCLLVAAAAKSAQFPFSSWMPRAMEGPTPSSAIFYGSLSIHFGVFLLIRTMPFWEQQVIARFLIGGIGILTALVGYSTAKVQPTIKTQIAYASVAQIGLMFVEIALGLENLALIHFVGNAFLRTYQLLVSPSVVAYLIREQFYHYKPYQENPRYFLGKRFHYTWYMLSLREFYLDSLMYRIIFNPFKKIGSKLNFLNYRNVGFYFVPTYVIGWVLYVFEKYIPVWLHQLLPVVFASFALMMVMKAFSERKSPYLVWILTIMGHFWIALAVSHNEHFGFSELIWYLSGVVVAGLTGWLCLYQLQRREASLFNLYRYFGHSYEYPRLAGAFLLSCLGLMGFPITTTFIGEDLVFSHIYEHQFALAFLLSSFFVIEGIALIRVYARLFLGNHAKVYHETPLQSS
jgi:NADH:ubiquinone oxidoreductase subunit 5 (subunit L)/multisubunit Na+/H+ antiporter MnhA subunit